jgi:hypothetical protein
VELGFNLNYLALLVGSFGFALLPFNYAKFIEYVRNWNVPCVVTGVLKFVVAYNIVFYALNGLRLLVSLVFLEFTSRISRVLIWQKARI